MAHLQLVILHYNTADLLRQCLEHIVATQTRHTYSIIVVDNGSTDGQIDEIVAHYPAVRVIRSPTNRGFAGGNNLALRSIAATAPAGVARQHEYVLLLNTDLFLAPDTAETLVNYLEAHPAVGVVGPRINLANGTLDLACRRSFPTPLNSLFKLTGLSRRFPGSARLAAYNLTNLDPAELTEVDSVVGACMLIRLSTIDDVGLLDERFFMYGEDLDWCFRIKARGWRVIYNPATVVVHLKGATSARQSGRMIVEFYRAMYLFYRKHYAPRSPRPFNWLVTGGIMARGMVALALNMLRPATGKRVA